MQVCGTVDISQRHSHNVQQMGAIILWISLSSSLDTVAHVLLLSFGVYCGEAWLRRSYQHEQ